MRFVATARLQQEQGMLDRTPGAESTAIATERRASHRLRAASLIYVDLGNGNGGIATWISESGMALTVADILKGSEQSDELLEMQIQFPGTPGVIKADGQIVWASESGKEAGVKFAHLEREARQQIKSWISEQITKNGLGPEQPALPKMQLPTAGAPKKRGSRLSFAEVASSRVGAEAEIPIGEAESPPSPLESNTFVDGSRAVASAFENPAFTEEQKAQASSDGKETQTSRAPREAHHHRQAAPVPDRLDRRSHPRRSILLFTYAVLGEDNGGLVFNLGEGGLALTAAAVLRDSHFGQIRVRFPDSEDWIEAKGRLAWISDSGKEAGIELLSLAEDVRARIREWVSLGEPEANSQLERAEVRPSQDSALPLRGFEGEESSTLAPAPLESTVPYEEWPQAPVASRSALFMSGVKGVIARAAVRKRVAKIKPPKPARRPRQVEKPRGSAARKALVPAAAVVFFAAGWVVLQRTHLNEATSVVAQNIPSTAIPSESREKTLAAPESPIADSPIRQNENSTPQAGTPKPLAENLNASVDSAVKQSVQTQSNEGRQRAPARNPTPPHGADRIERKTRPPRNLQPAPRRSVAPTPVRAQESRIAENKFVENKPAESKPVESKPIQTAEVLPSPNKELNAAPPSSNATPTRSEAATTLSKENEASPVAAKPPEIPVPRTPVVTVSFDPYPSILMPKKENSKKSRQGQSLQMGILVRRVDPVYPQEAKQQGIVGAVKLHVIFSREGAVESLTSMSGPPLLVPAAMNAVRQWRYSPTVLGGQPMETEEDVTVLFRLSSGGSKN